MNNNDIEDIHTIMRIRNIFEHLKNYGWVNDITKEINPQKVVQAIENILADRERLEIENKKLIEARNWYFEHTVNQIATPEILDKILRAQYNIPELQDKANKYDRLVERIKKDIEEYPEATYTKYYLLDCLGLLEGGIDNERRYR